MKFLILIFTGFFIFSSCSKTPDEKTIRLYAHASENYASGNFLQTIEILRTEKNFPPALLLRAKAEFFSGEYENAEKTCRRILKLQPSSFEAKLYLARIYREKNETAKALQLTESLLADNPQDIRVLRLAASLVMEAGKIDEASVYLDRAAEFSAESAMVLLDRARLRWIAGKGSDAIEDLSRARAMLPWDTPLLRTISNLENTIKEFM